MSKESVELHIFAWPLCLDLSKDLTSLSSAPWLHSHTCFCKPCSGDVLICMCRLDIDTDDRDKDTDTDTYIVDRDRGRTRDRGRNRCRYMCLDICTDTLAWPEFRAGLPGSLQVHRHALCLLNTGVLTAMRIRP